MLSGEWSSLCKNVEKQTNKQKTPKKLLNKYVLNLYYMLRLGDITQKESCPNSQSLTNPVLFTSTIHSCFLSPCHIVGLNLQLLSCGWMSTAFCLFLFLFSVCNCFLCLSHHPSFRIHALLENIQAPPDFASGFSLQSHLLLSQTQQFR